MKKLRIWLIKKLIGNQPVIMNVTLTLAEPILGAGPEGIFDKCNISYSEHLSEGGAI